MTGIAGDLTRVLGSLTLTYMLMLDRDRRIVMSVGRFRQLATAHLFAMHFEGSKSTTRLKSALTRLVDSKYLSRIERRMVGGSGAGSGQYVYQLGREGWKLYGHGMKFWQYRAVDYHTLGIADAYVELLELQQAGKIDILHYETEPESWRSFDDTEIRPDLFAVVRELATGKVSGMWFEVDMGTERESKIEDKLIAYWNVWPELTKDVEGIVVFLSPDPDREKWLRRVIAAGREETQKLFIVSNVRQFGALFFS